MIRPIAFALSLALLAGLPSAVTAAELEIVTATYHCERGVAVPVAYINTDGPGAVVLTVEGRQIALAQQISASGARFAWPSGGSGYVWWSRGDSATLYWHDGETGEEVALYTACEAR
jgi:membrane-bound inhibitor of C-type lysozyme